MTNVLMLPAPTAKHNIDYFMTVYNSRKANESTNKVTETPKARKFVEIEKKPRRIVKYDVPEMPDEEYNESFAITAEPVVDVQPNQPKGWFATSKEVYKVVCKETVMRTTPDYDKAVARLRELERCGLKADIRTISTRGFMPDREKSFIFNGSFRTQLNKIDNVTTTYTCMIQSRSNNGEQEEVVKMNLHELNDYLASIIYAENISKKINDIKSFQITNKTNYNGKSAVTEYCVIDHVNSINNKKLINKCYSEANRLAVKMYGVPQERVYKMKDFCNRTASHGNWAKRDNGYGYKMRVRHRYNPTVVILICENIKNFSARQVYNAWKSHGVNIEVIQADTFMNERQFYTAGSAKRRTVGNWAYACDWSLSAPLTRDTNLNSLETYCKRSDADALREAGEMHVTKTSSRPESFLEQQRAVTPKREVDRLHKTAFACKRFAITHPHATDNKFWTTEGFDVEEFFDIDKVKCPHCGKAMNPHNHKDENQRETEFIICTNCETEFPEDTFEMFECKPYYEDNGDDNDSDYDS